MTWAAPIVLYGAIVGRLCMAAVFLYSGQDKLRHWRKAVAEVAELKLPVPAAMAGGTIAVQLIGGLSLVSNFETAIGAALLAGFTIAATLIGHRYWLLTGDPAKQAFTTALEHLAIVGGLMLVAVDALRGG
jgi:putative oxidoreductase